MKRSTKRVVGWGTGVAVGVVLILLASVLVILLNVDGGAPNENIGRDHMVQADVEENIPE